MKHCSSPKTSLILILAGISLVLASTAGAVEIWSGYGVYFEKVAYADWNLPENQDRITPSVWITRKDTQGIFNIAQEDGYTSISPMDTEWATGVATDWESLTFTTWVGWTGGNPAGTIGVNAVVHLISDDIYVDIRFETFVGGNTGGAFSYSRADGSVPVQPTAISLIKKLY